MGDVRPVSGGLVVRVEKPKGYEGGKQPREVGLDPKAQGLLEEWLEVRGREPGPVFLTHNGGRVHPSHLRRLVRRLAKRAGIAQRVHPHALRHTCARQMYDEGIGLVEIRLTLGHSKLGTTQRYLESIGATEVINVTTARRW
jgi:integrase